jgi:acyl carrier protein
LDALRQLIGAPVSADARLEADLGLDSLDLTALAAVLRLRFGDRLDLAGFLAGLELDELIALTAGQLADWVANQLLDSKSQVDQ